MIIVLTFKLKKKYFTFSFCLIHFFIVRNRIRTGLMIRIRNFSELGSDPDPETRDARL